METSFWEKSFTPVRFPRAPFELKSQDRVMFLGSCFAEELSARYEKFGLPYYQSPFGLIYNPLSMGMCLAMLQGKSLQPRPFFHQNLWRHYAFHSSRCTHWEGEDVSMAEDHFQSLIESGFDQLAEADYLIMTLGTAWVYYLKESGMVVNNCHKRDNRLFERDLYYKIAGGGTSHPLVDALDLWKGINPRLRVIVTVSPVRHLRDDARENSLSKALLRCLCHDLCEERDWISYFPAYEIMMDELRDYRWYDGDLSHPSARSVDYIISRFFSWCGSGELLKYLPQAEKEFRRSQHRPLS